MLNEMQFDGGEASEPPKRGWSFTSFLPSKRTFKKIGANLLELTGTALQIASEITTFVAGMGFFITPPLKKVYSQLQGKNMHYSVNGTGVLCVEMRDLIPTPTLPYNLSTISTPQQNTICNTFNNQPLIASDVEFNLGYPESLFAASTLLLSLGCTGYVVAQGLKKYGASLHDWDETMPPTAELVVRAKKGYKPLLVTSALFSVGARIAAVYATTTISMTMTLRKVPGILEDFSITSSKNFVYNYDNTTLTDAPAQSQLLKLITMHMNFITTIDFSELRAAARKGSQDIDNYDFYIGISIAGVALLLGYIALKLEQQKEHYEATLVRHKNFLKLQPGLQERDELILKLKGQIDRLQLEHSTPLIAQPSVGSSPHSLFHNASPREDERSPLPNAVCITVSS